jgi:hypothetical protein
MLDSVQGTCRRTISTGSKGFLDKGVPGDAGRSKAPSDGQSLACTKRDLLYSTSFFFNSFL